MQLFGDSPQEVQLWRGRHHGISEVEQMCNRVKYITLSYQFTEEERREVDPCGHCGDRLYVKGLTASAALPPDATYRSFKRGQCRCHCSGADGAEEAEGRASLGCGRIHAIEAQVVGGVIVNASRVCS